MFQTLRYHFLLKTPQNKTFLIQAPYINFYLYHEKNKIQILIRNRKTCTITFRNTETSFTNKLVLISNV